MKTIKAGLLALCCLISIQGSAQNAGDLDTSFNTTGKYTFDYGFQDNITSVCVQPADQKIVVAGTAITPSFSGKLLVTRLLPNGTPDLTFANGGSLVITNFNESYAYEVLVRTDGKLLVAGSKADPAFQFSTLVMRLNNDGTIDTTFGNAGFATHEISTGDDFALAAAEQPDHKIVLAGSALDASFNNQPSVVRLLENGDIDSTFGVNGVALISVSNNDNKFNSVFLQPDGKIVASGHIDNGLTLSGQFDFDLITARFNADGTPDNTFGTNGIVITSTAIDNVDDAFGNALTSDGKILVSGFRVQPNFSYDAILLQYDSTGLADPSFGTNGLVVFDENVMDVSFDVKVQTDGKILSAGISGGFFPDDNDFWLARYNSDGTPDNTFGINGRVITTILSGYDEAEAMAIQNDGKAVLAGKSYNGVQNDIAVARFLTDGTSGLADENDLFGWVASPNPVAPGALLRISGLQESKSELQIALFNLLGQPVVTPQIICTGCSMPTYRLPETISAGCYFLKIQSASGRHETIKLVVTE